MSDSELVSELYFIQLDNWMELSMDALAIFEFVTTLDQEVSSVWKRTRSGASLLLFAVRYRMLATAIRDLAAFAQFNYQECVVSFIANDVFILLGYLLTAMFSALRVYALCGGSVRLSAVTFVLQLSPLIVNAYTYTGITYSIDPLLGCLARLNVGVKTEKILVLASRIPLILGDAFVVIITWIKSFQQLKMQHSLRVHLPLSTLLFRDGTVYFMILLIINILELCPLISYNGGYVISEINGALPLILINRFMLNLHQSSNDETRSAPYIRTITTPMFQMSIDIAGNMGESLEHGWETETRDDDEVGPQDGPQSDKMLELQEALQDDGFEIQEVLRGDEEAGPSGHRSEYD